MCSAQSIGLEDFLKWQTMQRSKRRKECKRRIQRQALGPARPWPLRHLQSLQLFFHCMALREKNILPKNYTKKKSAHTALAVKACLLGGNSNTKCSMTFVNIAVAISALAGGGPKTVSHRDQNTVVFSTFFEDFGCLSARGYWNGILGHFGSFPAMEKRPKMKKTLCIARFLQGFWMPEHWKHCKNKCFGLTL